MSRTTCEESAMVRRRDTHNSPLQRGGESLPGCPVAGVLAALMKNYKNGLQKFPISIILKVEPHGFLHFLQYLSAHRPARPDFQILIWNIF